VTKLNLGMLKENPRKRDLQQ